MSAFESTPVSRRKHITNGAAAAHPPQAGWQAAGVPPRYANDPLTVGRYCFTLPLDLLQLLQPVIGNRIPAADWTREHDLAAVVGDHRSQVGFFDGRPVNYMLLRSPRPLPTATLHPNVVRKGGARLLSQSIAATKFNNAMSQAAERLERAALAARGYCG